MDTWLVIVAALALGVLPALFTVVPLIRGGRRNRRLLRSGVQAPAVIVAIDQTGTQVNDQPVCELRVRVEPTGEPAFDAVARRVVPITQIPQLQPGQRIVVRYEPGDRATVAIEGLGEVAIDPARAKQMIEEAQQRHDALNRPGSTAGVAATAIVTTFDPTGVTVNGPNPLVVLRLKVLPPGGAPFDAELVGVFASSGLHKYQPGKEVHVRFDPAAPARVAFDAARVASIKSG
ncbi:MAG: hypothetical protein ACTHU0_04610 [Kofleriaceae bacterium]